MLRGIGKIRVILNCYQSVQEEAVKDIHVKRTKPEAMLENKIKTPKRSTKCIIVCINAHP